MDPYKNQEKIESSWEGNTAGGPKTCDTYEYTSITFGLLLLKEFKEQPSVSYHAWR